MNYAASRIDHASCAARLIELGPFESSVDAIGPGLSYSAVIEQRCCVRCSKEAHV
jgi:hypothetical protein